MSVGFFCRKANLFSKPKPFGIKLTFEKDMISVEASQQVEDYYSEEKTLAMMILEALEGGLSTAKDIAEKIGVNVPSVWVTLNRLKKKKKVVNLGEGKWGLTADNIVDLNEARSNQLSEEAKKKLAELKQHKKEVKKLLEERKANELLKKQGWFLLKSSVLGEVVAVAKDEDTKVPGNYVAYTLDEISMLQKEFNNGQLDEEGLKTIHKAKKKFGPKARVWNARTYQNYPTKEISLLT